MKEKGSILSYADAGISFNCIDPASATLFTPIRNQTLINGMQNPVLEITKLDSKYLEAPANNSPFRKCHEGATNC